MLTFEANDLALRLKALRACADPRAHIDVLKFVLVSAGSAEMRLATCNLDRRADAAIPCSGDLQPVCAPLWFLERLGAEKGARVGIERKGGGLVAFVGRARFDAPTLPAADFPGWTRTLAHRVELDGDTLADALDFVAPAMGSEAARTYLNGALWQPGEGGVHVVGCDGHRAHWVWTAVAGIEGEAVIIPREVVGLFSGLARGADACLLEWGRAGVALTIGGICIRSKAVEGDYPDWRRVVPARSGNAAEIDMGSALASIERVSAAVKASGDRGSAVHLVPHGVGLAVGVGGVAQDVFASELSGGLRPFTLSADYLLSALRAFRASGATSVTLDMADPGKPVGLRARGIEGGVSLMPMTPLGLPMIELEGVEEREAA